MNEDLTSHDRRRAWWILAMNTLAFTVCFAAWMMNGVLVTFLVDNGLQKWDPAQIGWLIGIPVLSGSLFRLPIGLATDKWGGRIVYSLLLVASAIGKAAVHKHIPDYFPSDVGVVGGIVGVLGGLGGFVCPVIFGYLLKATGLWTSCWMFFLVLIVACLVWMHLVIRRMMNQRVPELMQHVEASFHGDGERETTSRNWAAESLA